MTSMQLTVTLAHVDWASVATGAGLVAAAIWLIITSVKDHTHV